MKKNRFKKIVEEVHQELIGKFADEIKELTKLTPEDVDLISPGESKSEVYSKLLKIVQKASRDNIKQSELLDDIKELGANAVTLAKKVPGLSKLFI